MEAFETFEPPLNPWARWARSKLAITPRPPCPEVPEERRARLEVKWEHERHLHLRRLGIESLDQPQKPVGMSKAEWKIERQRVAAELRAEALVNPFLQNHGDYQEGTVVDLSGELGGRRMSIVKVMLNRGGTAIERWIAADPSARNRLFEEPQQRAIRYCQNLWVRVEGGVRAIDPTADVIDAPLGWSQQEAFVELKRIEKRVPDRYWDVFENVCRFDQEAGTAGSSIATNSRSAIDAAKTTVAYTASLIAMWRRL